jgi:hypothetical protein
MNKDKFGKRKEKKGKFLKNGRGVILSTAKYKDSSV